MESGQPQQLASQRDKAGGINGSVIIYQQGGDRIDMRGLVKNIFVLKMGGGQ